jgi:copper transport protein
VQRLHRVADTRPEHISERLRRAVVVESFIGVSVLAFTAVLVAQPRGAEALAAKYREPISASTSLGNGRSVEVTVDPGTHGLVNVTVELSDPAQSVTASATEKARQIGPVPLKLAASGRTLYAANGVNLPVAGLWEFDLVVTESKFDAITADITITLH